MVELIAERRKSIGHQVKSLRRNGQLPAVLYGADNESQPISVDARSFGKVLKEAGESTLVELVVDGKKHNVLIHDVQVDPLTDAPVHADFLSVRMDKEIHAKIPFEFIGESPAVKGESGILVKVMHELEVEADPMNLPHNIEVDISMLAALGDKIHASDLALPSGIKLVTPDEEVVALVQEVIEEKEEVVAPADISTIEVEKKGKEEEMLAPEEKK